MSIREKFGESVLGQTLAGAAIKAITWAGWTPGQEGLQFVGSSQSNIEQLNYSYQVGNPLNSPLVMAAGKWHIRNVHSAPMFVVRRNEENIIQSKTLDHPALQLIRRPNDYYNGKLMMKSVGVSWMLSGNAYILKLRDADGVVQELWYEPHYSIRVRWPGDNVMSPNQVPQPSLTGEGSKFISFYEIYRMHTWHRVETDDVVHFKDGCDPRNPRLGINGISSLMAEIYTDQQRAHFSATVLGNLGMVPFVVSPRESNMSISEKSAEKLKEDLVIRAKTDRGKPIVAGRAIRVDELGIKPKQMALQEMAQIPEERVAAVIGPNAYVLGFIPERSNFSNLVEARRDAYESYLIPVSDYFADELTSEVYEELDSTPHTALEYDFFDVPALIDHKAKLFEIWGKGFRDGVATRKSVLLATSQTTEGDKDDIYIEDIGGFPTSLGTSTDKFGAGPPSQQGQNANLPPRDQYLGGNERPSLSKDKGPVLGGKK